MREQRVLGRGQLRQPRVMAGKPPQSLKWFRFIQATHLLHLVFQRLIRSVSLVSRQPWLSAPGLCPLKSGFASGKQPGAGAKSGHN